MSALLQDLQFAVRFLLRNKRTSVIAILCLGLGIAMTSATFSGVSPWVYRELPWPEPRELVWVGEEQRSMGGEGRSSTSGAGYLDWVRHNRVFQTVAAYRRVDFNVSTGDEPQRVRGASVSASLFPMLGVEPLLGRLFTPEEDIEGRGGVALISYGLWRRQFGSDPHVVGKTIRLSGRTHDIVGVLPERVDFPEWRHVWTPLALPVDGPRDVRDLGVVARLKDGVTLAQASADMDRVGRAIEASHPKEVSGWQVFVRSYRDELIPKGIVTGLTIMMVGCFLVVLIACANAASLLLAQAASREKEIALRGALGASRARIVRQLLTESALIALVSGALALALAPLMMDMLMSVAPTEPPNWAYVEIDRDVIVFTVLVSLGTGLIFGLVPALRASQSDFVGALKEGGRSATRGVRSSRMARGLVALELALSVVLLVSATLMARSYSTLQEIDQGYDRENILTWRVTLSSVRYDEAGERERFAREVLRRVGALPQVRTVGTANVLPLVEDGWASRRLEIEGQPVERTERPSVTYYSASEDFLESMGVDVVAGRSLTRDDVESHRDVVLVSEGLARRFWPGESVLGRRIRLDEDEPWRRVVGVTNDIKQPFDVAGVPGPPPWQVWVPLPAAAPVALDFALHSRGDVASIAPLVRSEIRAVDPELPVYRMMSIGEAEARVIWVSKQFGVSFAALSIAAIALASFGLYGLISYAVAQRTQEMGIRMALGAQPGDVLRLVMKQGMQLTLIGVGLGIVLAVLMASAMASLIYGVEPYDPITFAGTTALLVVVSLAATAVPAWRATRVDPVVSLRQS